MCKDCLFFYVVALCICDCGMSCILYQANNERSVCLPMSTNAKGCQFKTAICNFCQKSGHIQKACTQNFSCRQCFSTEVKSAIRAAKLHQDSLHWVAGVPGDWLGWKQAKCKCMHLIDISFINIAAVTVVQLLNA